MGEHEMEEQLSAIPGDDARRVVCGCGWRGLWRSQAHDGDRWYGRVALDMFDHLRAKENADGLR